MKRRPRHASSILIVEANRKVRERLAREMKDSGHSVLAAGSRAEAEALMADDPPALLLCAASVPGADDLVRALKTRGQKAPACVLLVRDASGPSAARAEAMGADNYLVYPLKGADILACVRWLDQIRALRAQLEPRDAPDASAAPAAARGLFDPGTGFYTFESFKQILFVEVKRALRYGFPLSVAMITYDPFDMPQSAATADVKAQLHGGLAVAIRKSLRDTDLPVYYKGENVLVVMPHTDRAGAGVVGRRILGKVTRSALRVEGGHTVRPSISIGIGWAQDLKTESFAEIIKLASRHLAEARREGGGRIRPED